MLQNYINIGMKHILKKQLAVNKIQMFTERHCFIKEMFSKPVRCIDFIEFNGIYRHTNIHITIRST